MPRILIIRAGALGDLVLCGDAMAAIRRHHADAEIALLTRAPFAAFAAKMPWLDHIITDPQPATGDIAGWLRLRRAITTFAPDLIYDLQGKRRQSVLYALLGGPFGPDWSGAAPLCRFPRLWPPAPGMSFRDFLAAQLHRAGINATPAADWSWLDAPVARFALPTRFVLLIPGCSPTAPFKRWPHYADLATALAARGIASVAVGTQADADSIAALRRAAPGVIDLGGQTSLFELAGLALRAVAVIGNDTGPTHLAAAAGAPTLALFSSRGNPVWSRPPGPRVATLQQDLLTDLSAQTTLAALDRLLQNTEQKA